MDGDMSWYCAVPVGQKTLAGFMTKMSKLLNLSRTYTNHCIRATGTTLLSRSGFHSAQIMLITGHKSVSSLAIYQRVNDQEKIHMGNTLTRFVDRNIPQSPAIIPQNNLSASSSSSNINPRPTNSMVNLGSTLTKTRFVKRIIPQSPAIIPQNNYPASYSSSNINHYQLTAW